MNASSVEMPSPVSNPIVIVLRFAEAPVSGGKQAGDFMRDAGKIYRADNWKSVVAVTRGRPPHISTANIWKLQATVKVLNG